MTTSTYSIEDAKKIGFQVHLGTDKENEALLGVSVVILFTQEDIATFRSGKPPAQVTTRTFATVEELKAYKEGFDAIEDEVTEVEELTFQGCSVIWRTDGDDEHVVTTFNSEADAQAFFDGIKEAEGFSDPLIVEPGDEGYDRLLILTQPLSDADYVKTKGNHCPRCRGVQIQGGEIEIGGKEAVQEVTCSDCGASWSDIYALVGYEDLETA